MNAGIKNKQFSNCSRFVDRLEGGKEKSKERLIFFHMVSKQLKIY